MVNKKVSVIIPSYNHSKYIDKAIESVLNQKCDCEIELIVVDDCSQDDTKNVIEELQKKFNFTFIGLKENRGVNNAIKMGVSVATGEFYSFLASDDFYLEDKLQKQLNLLVSNDFDCVYARASVFNEEGDFLFDQNLEGFNSDLLNGQHVAYNNVCKDDTSGPLLQSAILNKRAVLEMISVQAKFRSDDWVVLLSLLKNAKVGFLNCPVFGYRLHNQNSHKNFWKMFSYRVEVVSSYIAVESECNFPSSFSNLLISQSAILFRNKKYKLALRFAISSLAFGFPLKKLIAVFKRKFCD